MTCSRLASPPAPRCPAPTSPVPLPRPGSLFAKLRLFLALARPFWSSEERWTARLLLGSVVILVLAQNWVLVRLNFWERDAFDTIQRGDYASFVSLGVIMLGLIVCSIFFWLTEDYLFSLLKIRWRRWMTDRYLRDWLGDRAHYLGQLGGHQGDNPDQRISEDVRLFVFTTLDLAKQLFAALVALASFAVILWQLSLQGATPAPPSPYPFPALPESLSWLSLPLETAWVAYVDFTYMVAAVPGYLVWICLAYSLIGMWLVGRVGQPIIGLNYEQQKLEADFRFGLVRLRENSESTALVGGERAERRSLGGSFARIVGNFYAILVRRLRLNAFKSVYYQLSDFVPILLCAPRFFAGALSLGQLMQLRGAFKNVLSNLNFFVNSYEIIAQWWAITQRLDGFQRGIAHSRALRETQREIYSSDGANNLVVSDLALFRPDGRPLIAPFSFTVHPGDSVLVTGPSGSGKSTILRALVGLWPYESGHVALPAAFDCMVMPQKPYLPIGTLRAALAYPREPEVYDDVACRQALELCELPGLFARLDEEAHWAQTLSGGEQQRLALARVFLHRPAWLFLDEATAAIDENAELMFYHRLRAALPGLTYVTIAHRGSLRNVHARHLKIEHTGAAVPVLREDRSPPIPPT